MFEKYDQVWNKIGIKDHMLAKSCSDKIKQMGWLLYVIFKFEMFEKNQIQLDQDYSSILEQTLSNMPDYTILI